MKILIIGSGSKGNATFIQTNHTKILIDCGISLLQIKKRLEEKGLSLDNLNGVFITHEHTDHIKHLYSVLTKNPTAKLYIEKKTFKESEIKLGTSLKNFDVEYIQKDTRYTINNLDIVPIELSHDVVNCFGYLVREYVEGSTESNLTFGTLTDTGYIPSQYNNILAQMNTLLIESNHDIKMLESSGRPIELIERIFSNHGHMNNVDTSKFLKNNYCGKTKRVILGHISEDCNEPTIALNEVKKVFNNEVPFILQAAEQHNSLYVTIGEEDD